MVSPAYARIPDQAIDYYQQGNFAEAKRILEEYLSCYPGDEDALFYMGQLESDGRRSTGHFEKILSLSDDFQKEDQILLRLCQYSFSKGFYLNCSNLASRFDKKLQASPCYSQILWLSASASLASGNTEKAKEKYQKLSSFADLDWKPYARLGTADCLFAEGQFSPALGQYKEIIEEFGECDVLPLALIQISSCYAKLGEENKSVLYYNLYKEKSPHGIRIEEDSIKKPELKFSKEAQAHKAEDMVNARYVIQLGAFGTKENAESLFSLFKAKGYAVKIKNKVINGKKYYLVQLGSFRSYQEAQTLREELEKASGGSYRIILK